MNRLVVDANIIIRMLIKPNGKNAAAFGLIPVPFYAPSWLEEEIEEKWDVLISPRTYVQNTNVLRNLWEEIKLSLTFINDTDILLEFRMYAGRKLAKADPDDAPYFALALHLDCPIWTNDGPLSRALGGVPTCYSTDELIGYFGLDRATEDR